MRLDGEELRTPGGITLADAVATARIAVEAGADAISMSAYASIDTGSAFTEAPLPQAPDAYVAYARAVRAAVDVPVIAAGRIEPDERRRRTSPQGDFDFVAMARKLLADPDIPIKLEQNRPQDIRPCIYCYACVSQIFINQRVKCAVNALTGHESEAAIEPAASAAPRAGGRRRPGRHGGGARRRAARAPGHPGRAQRPAWAARCSSPAWPIRKTAACSTTWSSRSSRRRSRSACRRRPRPNWWRA